MRQRTDNTLDIAYQVDEQPPLSKTLGVGLQLACLAASSMILTPALVFRVTGFDENVIVSVVFTTLVICGCIIALHARPIGRFGSGYILAIGPTSAAIAVTVDNAERWWSLATRHSFNHGGRLAVHLRSASVIVATSHHTDGCWHCTYADFGDRHACDVWLV